MRWEMGITVEMEWYVHMFIIFSLKKKKGNILNYSIKGKKNEYITREKNIGRNTTKC